MAEMASNVLPFFSLFFTVMKYTASSLLLIQLGPEGNVLKNDDILARKISIQYKGRNGKMKHHMIKSINQNYTYNH